MFKLITYFFIVFLLLEFLSYLVYCSKSFERLKNFFDTPTRKKRKKGDIRTFALRYAEHPFLAMTLNSEFRNSLGEKIHNKYGFRCNNDFAEIINNQISVIYCAGGSSTYCNFIERNEDTWPGVLEAKINESFKSEKIDVINAACSGWTSFQSLIRFCAWVDILRPKLVIIYHGKNDLMPFVNSKNLAEIFPDYSNVMRSLKLDFFSKKINIFARFTFLGKVAYGYYINRRYLDILSSIYNLSRRTTPEERRTGLMKIGEREWKFLISRYRSFILLCKARNIHVLSVTQIVKDDIYRPYIEELNNRIKKLANEYDNCFVYDFAGESQANEKLLYDSVHFSKEGARIFAEKVNNYIHNNINLFQSRTAKIC